MKTLLFALFFSLSMMTYAQDCTQVYVEVSSGAQDNEIGWNIAQSNGWAILSGAVGSTNSCIQDGCWTFTMYDGGGDGWAGSIITIFTDEAVLFSGTLNDGNYEVNDLQIGNSEPCEEPAYGCEYEGILYQFGTSIQQECNSCFCEPGFNPNANGFWGCTEQDCSYGCTDESASNYIDYATEDDGSCEWLDCDGGLSYTSLNILIEDSLCHSNLYCEDYNWDGGDCVFDCNNDLMTIWDIDGYFYNGQCDEILNCMAYNFDNESCLEPQGCEDENGVSYDHGVQWSIDPCTLCSCENGEISCITIDCAIPECEAPNYLQDVQGQCCPVCVEVELETDCTVQNIPIELNVGWGMFGYTCLEPQNVIDAFSSITADIIILKDYLGNAYLPEWDFNGIGSLAFARGYQIKMYQTVEGFQFCPTLSVTQVSGQDQIDQLQMQLDQALENISSLEQEIASIIPEDGISQEDVDAAVAAVELSYEGCIAPIYGCTGPDHCNYNALANTDDGSCVYAQEGYDCYGNVLIQIGDQHAGGIVFQINEDGTGLVADLQDLGVMNWYDAMDMVASVTSQGYDDWYLPSLEELTLMYNTLGQGADNSGNFEYGFYWSSTEIMNNAWGVDFGTGAVDNGGKVTTNTFRIIRAF